ncbi:MAG: SDR family NAD(P)-dependent oxidoreductase [Microscillaceae bacterium]|nr:SDR family NAD(P)-dependent oxidoreductase [Microscillaceae bacterium]
MKPICIIAGMGPGVSMGVAQLFAQKGYALLMLARNLAKLEKYAADFKAQGHTAYAASVELSHFENLRQQFPQLLAQYGPPEVLVYNAAVLRQGVPSQMRAEDLLQDFQINVGAALVCAQQVIPAMAEAKKGTLLFTGGGLALEPYYRFASLAVGKAGLRNLAQSLAQELAPKGLKVGTVTIAGLVKEGTHFDPARIAEKFWELHQAPLAGHPFEIIYR